MGAKFVAALDPDLPFRLQIKEGLVPLFSLFNSFIRSTIKEF